MATWREIGVANFDAGIVLYDDAKQYRSAVSRFYYAVFSILTDELIGRNAKPDFKDNRDTPGHAQLARLIEVYFGHFSDEKKKNLIGYVKRLYRDRIVADYSQLRVDQQSAKGSYRSAEKIFAYLEVKHE